MGVLHAVPVGKGETDIDHVVLGPGGVFTINTKHHPGKPVWVAGRSVLVAGHRQPYVPKAEGEAQAAARLLSAALHRPVPVRPVIALVGASRLTVREAPEHVHVTTERRLVRWLLAQPSALPAADLAALLPLAERPTTWHAAPPPLGPAGLLEQRLRQLERAVASARRTRAVWAGTAGVGALVVLGAVGPGLLQAALEAALVPR